MNITKSSCQTNLILGWYYFTLLMLSVSLLLIQTSILLKLPVLGFDSYLAVTYLGYASMTILKCSAPPLQKRCNYVPLSPCLNTKLSYCPHLNIQSLCHTLKYKLLYWPHFYTLDNMWLRNCQSLALLFWVIKLKLYFRVRPRSIHLWICWYFPAHIQPHTLNKSTLTSSQGTLWCLASFNY